MKHVNRTITILVFIFLYIPMIVLAVASFNTGTDIASFKGFTLRQYANLFQRRHAPDAAAQLAHHRAARHAHLDHRRHDGRRRHPLA